MLLFYVRHGDPIYNPDDLTPLGRRQAEALGKRLSKYGIDEIYASDSNRAVLTAKPTAEMVKKEPTLLHWCNEGLAWQEFTVIDSEGRKKWMFQDTPTNELFRSDEVVNLGNKWYEHPAFAETKAKEGTERINAEIKNFFSLLGYERCDDNRSFKCVNPNDKRIALFAHQGFGMAFMSCLLNIPYPLYSTHFDMGHTGVTVIEFKNSNGYSVPQVLQLSNDSHLYAENLPTKYQNRLYF